MFASLTSVPSSSVFDTSISSSNWHIFHPFKNRDILVQTEITPLPDNLIAEIRNINPSQVDIDLIYVNSGVNPELTGKTFILPVNPTSKFEQSDAADVWTFDATNFGLDFSNGIIPFLQVYSQDTVYLKAIVPQSISIDNSNIVTLTFSTPIAGYVLASTPGSVNWFSVKSAVKGLLGYSYTQGIFNHPDISFELLASVEIGSTVKLKARSTGFTIHPNTPEETWSLIKINPISYDKPLIGYKGFPKVSVYAAPGYIDMDWTITCVNVTATSVFFTVTGSNYGFNYGPFEVPFNEPSTFKVEDVLEFEIYPTPRGFKIGDYFTFNLGYDGDQYDLSGLEGSGNPGAPYDLEEVGYDYEAGIYTEILDPSEGGLYDAAIQELIDTWQNLDFELLPAKDTVKLLPLAAEFAFAPTERWTFTYNAQNRNFDVEGSISGKQAPAYIAHEYDNGFIRVRIVNPFEIVNVKALNNSTYVNDYLQRMIDAGALTDGLTIYFQLRDKRPNYLVVGSIAGQMDECVVGEYFWNGKIGFKLDLPLLKLSLGNNAPIILNQNTPVPLGQDATITALTAPRIDANPECLQLTFHNDAFLYSKLTENRRQFLVNSNTRGQLPAAVIGNNYYDVESSRSMPELHDVFNFRINELTNQAIPQDANFSLLVEAHPYQSVHSDGFVLLVPEHSSGQLKINTFREDIFTFSVDGYHPELGNNSTNVPTYITAANDGILNNYIPDRKDEYSVWLLNVKDKKVGTISWKFDTQAAQYKQVLDFDADFKLLYLPLNSTISFSTRQADQYNDAVKVKCSEHLFFRNEFISRDIIHIAASDKITKTKIKLSYDETASILIDLTNESFGWDTFAWDTDEFDINATNQKIKIDLLDQDVGGYGSYLYDLIDYDKTLFTSNNLNSTNVNIANTRITEGLSITVTSPTEDAGYGDVPYDYSGFETLENALIIFKQVDTLSPGPRWETPYSLINIQTPLATATLEMPQPSLSLIVASDINDLVNSQLVLDVDYTMEILNTDSVKEIRKINIINPAPVILLAYIS